MKRPGSRDCCGYRLADVDAVVALARAEDADIVSLQEVTPEPADALRRVQALRDLIGTGYVDAADAAGAGWETTWPVGRRLPGVTIDHVLVDERTRVEHVEVHGIPGSDHRAVVAEITLPPDR